MTTHEMLDRFSDVVLADQRILNNSERELLVSVLRNAADTTDGTTAETVLRAVGQTIAQRALSVLGSNIATRLAEPLRQSVATRGMMSAAPPRPPGPTPPSPGAPPPGPPGANTSLHDRIHAAPPRPPGPTPPSPQGAPPPPPPSPGPGISVSHAEAVIPGVAVLEPPELLPAHCVVLEEFLAPAELQALLQYAVSREADFRISEVICPDANSKVDFDHRRSRVLFDVGQHRSIAERVCSILPRVFERLGHKPFRVGRVETQITASNDGDFFHWHSDNSDAESASREITFVYFFHREPKQFGGGELRIYDSRKESYGYEPTENYRTIVPRQNQMVLFASSLTHEITQVHCADQAFANSRFTVNGWLHH